MVLIYRERCETRSVRKLEELTSCIFLTKCLVKWRQKEREMRENGEWKKSIMDSGREKGVYIR